ncbi:MAG: HAD family hydrolase [Lachnospiraceae bacterium]|nr:HAD family hydrolase [Lachnospiraceae bacterium]
MKYNYLFFDLDGTLTDSRLGITNSIVYALKKMNLPIPEDSVLIKFLGPPLVESFQNYCGLQEKAALEAVDIYREYFSTKGLYENEVYPGIREILEELKAKGYGLVVATSKPEQFSVRILEHFQLDVYFQLIAGSSMDTSRNSKESVIRYAIEQLGVTNPGDVLMIGDREHDVLGAKACKISCIGALWGYGSREELLEAGAVSLISRPEELTALL